MYIIQSHFQSKLLKIPARFNCKNTEEYVDTINSCLFESVGSLCCIHGKGKLIYQNSISSMSLMSVQWGYFRQTERESKFGRSNNT